MAVDEAIERGPRPSEVARDLGMMMATTLSSWVRRQVLVRPLADTSAPRVCVRETTKAAPEGPVRRRDGRHPERVAAETAATLKGWRREQSEERLAFAGMWLTTAGSEWRLPG